MNIMSFSYLFKQNKACSNLFLPRSTSLASNAANANRVSSKASSNTSCGDMDVVLLLMGDNDFIVDFNDDGGNLGGDSFGDGGGNLGDGGGKGGTSTGYDGGGPRMISTSVPSSFASSMSFVTSFGFVSFSTVVWTSLKASISP